MELLLSRDFNCWKVVNLSSPSERAAKDVPLMVSMFKRPTDLVERYKLNEDNLGRWIQAISDLYIDASYHNWGHAVDVAQGIYKIMATGGSKFLNYMDSLALYCSSIAHDVAHLGYTTAFLVRTSHFLAIRYNDKAPLENMHSSVFFETLNKEGHNFMEGTQKDGKSWHGKETFRAKVISAILATDMGQHMSFVDRWSTRTAQMEASPFMKDTKDAMKEMKNTSKADRRLLLEAFLHTADLGHNFRGAEVNRWGVMKLEEEWFRQGDEEAHLGIPISPNSNRREDCLASTQPFFMEAFIRPLLDPYIGLMKDNLDIWLYNMEQNKRMWEHAVQDHGPKTAPELCRLMDEAAARRKQEELDQEICDSSAFEELASRDEVF